MMATIDMVEGVGMFPDGTSVPLPGAALPNMIGPEGEGNYPRAGDWSMISSIGILVFSTALFIFYIQTLCENVLRREFSRAYFMDVLNALDLEFPRLRQAIEANVAISPAQVRLALRADYSTLTYLVKEANPNRRHFSWQEKMLIGYFRVLLMVLPICYALHFREREAVVKLTSILRHFANLAGERVLSAEAAVTVSNSQG